jgi:hypothetical protein
LRNIGLGFAAVLTSSVFIWMGLSILLADEPASSLVRAFSAGIFVYGCSSLALLARAWWHPDPALGRWAAAASTLLVFAWSAGSLDHEIISGLEVAAILVIAAVGWVNWYAVRKIAGR